eukprot:jgi/Ulvmu1/3468/UM016_0088.1
MSTTSRMSSFFVTPRHEERPSSAALKICLLSVLCGVLAGVLAIFPAVLIVDCDGNLESDDCDSPTGVLLAFLATVVLMSLCASCAVYLCISVVCLMGTKEKPQRDQSDLSYFRSPVSAGEAVRFHAPPDIRSMHSQQQRPREFSTLSTIQSAMDDQQPTSPTNSQRSDVFDPDRQHSPRHSAQRASVDTEADAEGFSRGGEARPIAALRALAIMPAI